MGPSIGEHRDVFRSAIDRPQGRIGFKPQLSLITTGFINLKARIHIALLILGRLLRLIDLNLVGICHHILPASFWHKTVASTAWINSDLSRH